VKLSVCAVLAVTGKPFLVLTSPSPSASSTSAFFFRFLGSNESVSCEPTLTAGVVCAFASASSSPNLRFDLLGGIVVFGHRENRRQQLHSVDLVRGLDNVQKVWPRAEEVVDVVL
jgi:hypothetical protein